MAIDNRAVVKQYETKGDKKILVESVWSDSKMVVIKIDGKEAMVIGSELKMAIDNCMNIGR